MYCEKIKIIGKQEQQKQQGNTEFHNCKSLDAR